MSLQMQFEKRFKKKIWPATSYYFGYCKGPLFLPKPFFLHKCFSSSHYARFKTYFCLFVNKIEKKHIVQVHMKKSDIRLKDGVCYIFQYLTLARASVFSLSYFSL